MKFNPFLLVLLALTLSACAPSAAPELAPPGLATLEAVSTGDFATFTLSATAEKFATARLDLYAGGDPITLGKLEGDPCVTSGEHVICTFASIQTVQLFARPPTICLNALFTFVDGRNYFLEACS